MSTMLNTEEDADAIVVSIEPPMVEMISTEAGLEIVSLEGLPISITSADTEVMITAEGVEIESLDINLTAETGVAIEAAATFDVTSGSVEMETGDMSVTAGAVEFESGLFTVM